MVNSITIGFVVNNIHNMQNKFVTLSFRKLYTRNFSYYDHVSKQRWNNAFDINVVYNRNDVQIVSYVQKHVLYILTDFEI